MADPEIYNVITNYAQSVRLNAFIIKQFIRLNVNSDENISKVFDLISKNRENAVKIEEIMIEWMKKHD